MILNNSGIDYSRMLLFVLGFLVQSGHVKVVKKTKCDLKEPNF